MSMNCEASEPTVTLDIDLIERWNVFNRLKELSIPCNCSSGLPLVVSVETPAAAVQVWCVLQRCLMTRDASVRHLAQCWEHSIKNDRSYQ